jgi:murein DD-endopeptidase MepM/ murein hydrolase activator NlpD
MATTLATAYIDIIPSMGPKGRMGKDIAREFAGVSRQAESVGKESGGRFSSAFKGSMAGIAGAFAAIGIGSFLKDAVQGAGNLEQSVGAIESVFKKSSGQMQQWSRNAAKDVGLTSNEFNELGTLIGSQLKNGGTAMEELAPKTKNLIGVGADLASMFGGTTKEAIEAMSSALRGESDPIERYGVSLSAARIEAKALEQGAKKVGGELSQQAKQTAILALITEQTADAQGNFARESDTFAHKQQVMAAEWGNLTTKIGELFLPVMTTTFAFISDKVIPVLGEGVGGIRAFAAAFKAGDGDITSTGLPGFMERVGGAARGLYDLFKGDYNAVLRSAFGWEEDHPMVVGVLAICDAAGKIPAAFTEIKDTAVPVLTATGDWLVKNKDWLLTIAVAVGSVVAAYKTYTTALAIHTATMAAYAVVTTVAGGAQAFFAGALWTAALGMTALNAVMKANLFGIIAFAIIGLVSGLIYFFTQTETGRKIVAAAWEGIRNVVGGVVDWFTNDALPAIRGFIGGIIGFFEDLGRDAAPAVEGVKSAVGGVASFLATVVGPTIKAVFDGVGAVFTWLYQAIVVPVVNGVKLYVGFLVAVFQGIYSVLKPVFDSVGVVLNGFYLGARGVFQLVSSLITYIVMPLFTGLWNRVVDSFAGIGRAIGDWWTSMRVLFEVVVGYIRKVVAGVFTWFLVAVIRPVWNSITGTIRLAWAAISAVFGVVVNYIRSNLTAAFTWIRGVVSTVFTAIGLLVGRWWNVTVKPIFDAVSGFVRNVLGPAFNWFYSSVIKPVWDRVGAAIALVWNSKVKPIFESLNKMMNETIPAAFKFGVGLAEKHWKTLQDIAKAPVKFVIDTVINDGLIGAFNTVAGVLPGIDKLPRVALPKGFADGGYTGDGAKYTPAGIVHAGEYVFTKEQTQRAGVGNLAALANSLTGYARGGIVNPLKTMALTQGYNRVHKGIDLAAAVGTPVFATQGGRVSWAGPGAQAPGVWGGNEVHVAGGNGIETWFAHLSQIGVKLGQQVRAGQQIGLSGNTGITSGPHLHFGTFNGGWPNDIDPLAYLGGAGIPAGGGFNPIEGIVNGLVDKFKGAFPAGGMIADIAIGIGRKVIDSATKWVTDTLSGNRDKGNATATVYDGGGWLENTGGSQLVQHNKRKPDAVLSSSQWDTMSRIAENASGGFVNHGTINVRDEEEMARIILTRQRDAQAAYGF